MLRVLTAGEPPASTPGTVRRCRAAAYRARRAAARSRWQEPHCRLTAGKPRCDRPRESAEPRRETTMRVMPSEKPHAARQWLLMRCAAAVAGVTCLISLCPRIVVGRQGCSVCRRAIPPRRSARERRRCAGDGRDHPRRPPAEHRLVLWPGAGQAQGLLAGNAPEEHASLQRRTRQGEAQCEVRCRLQPVFGHPEGWQAEEGLQRAPVHRLR